jgi:hypothetical protein
MAYYGEWVGPSDGRFRVAVDFSTTESGDDNRRVSGRYWLEVSGDLGGTIVDIGWYGQLQVYGTGTYADTGWMDFGYGPWGETVYYSQEAHYTGSTGTYYQSKAEGAHTPATPTWAPYAPTGVKHSRTSDTKHVVTWQDNPHAARPYTSLTVQRSTDGGAWANVKTGLAGTQAQYTDSTTTAGHAYSYRVLAVNAGGTTASSATAQTITTPAPPSDVKGTRESDNRVTVSWVRNCPVAALYTSQAVERSTDGGNWAALATVTSTATSYTDATTQAGHTYMYRVKAANGIGSTISAASGKVLTTPSAPTGAAVSRVSDAQNNVTWETSYKDSALYASQQVQRSTDGGAWQTVATVGGTVTSYADTTTGLGHAYAYRVGATNSAGAAYSGSTGTVYNTPAAPTVTAKRTGETDVSVTVSAVSYTATAIELQRMEQGGAWADLATLTTASPTYTDAPGKGTWRYRARATRGALKGAYSSASDYITPMQPPLAPTITTPASGAVVKTGKVTWVGWRHNAPDGTAQTAYEAQVSYDGGATWAALGSGTTATGCNITLKGEQDIQVRVRTKGADPDYGPWGTVGFYARYAPAITLTAPDVTAIPWTVSWDVGTMSGTIQRAALSIGVDGEAAGLTLELGAGVTSHEVTALEMVPLNGKTYFAYVLITSSYGLTSYTRKTFAVSYEAPGVPDVTPTIDAGRGAVRLHVEATDSDVATESLSLWRGSKLIAADLASGAEVTDTLPPLDMPVTYTAYAHAKSGVASPRELTVTVPSNSAAFLNWGDGWGECCRAARNLVPSREAAHEYETMTVYGEARPVAMYGEHVDVTGSIQADAWWLEDAWGEGETAGLEAWEAAEEHVGDYALRLPHSQAVRVRADVSHELGDTYGVATVTTDWQEVAGGVD